MKKVFISTSTFAEFDTAPVELLRRSGFEVDLNPLRRALTKDEILKLASGAHGLIAGTELIDAEILKALKDLKVISRCGSGTDNVDLKAAKELNIKVFNTPDGPTLAVAELTVGLILDSLRHISDMDRQLRAGKWKKQMGSLLHKKNIGIIGFGRIGNRVAKLLAQFEPNLAFYDIVAQKGDRCCALKPLSELLSWADVVTLHCSAQDDKPVIGKEELKQVKKGCILVNVSRGSAVDEDALYEALKSGRLGGAALDVFNIEPYSGRLRELDNVILTPHIGSYAKEARIEMEMQAVKNLLSGSGQAKI